MITLASSQTASAAAKPEKEAPTTTTVFFPFGLGYAARGSPNYLGFIPPAEEAVQPMLFVICSEVLKFNNKYLRGFS